MTERQRGDHPAEAPDEGEVFNLDDAKREPTGDPLVDRGMDLSMDEIEAAAEDPEHPDHEAAKAANAYIAKKLGGIMQAAYGDQFRRIGENLAAAIRPNMGSLFPTPVLSSLTADPVGPVLPESPRLGSDGAGDDLVDLEDDDTPQKTLDALLEVSERMSEMVRVSAEHRDVAVKQMEHFESEATAARRSERRMLGLTWLALIGTWVAVGVSLAQTL